MNRLKIASTARPVLVPPRRASQPSDKRYPACEKAVIVLLFLAHFTVRSPISRNCAMRSLITWPPTSS